MRTLRIAVLDDNLTIGEMVRQGLELTGHTVMVYSSPAKFLADIIQPTTASTPFDLIIIELEFPLPGEPSGVEVIHQVRNAFPDLPVILISTGSSCEIEAARRALSAVRVLRKPFSMANLLAMIQELKNG